MKPVTSTDVAKLAQVSQSAVSRTFTPGASVSDTTRQRVLDAARRLGYRPNAHARSLTTGRSNIIGLVMASLGNLFYPAALEQLARRLQRDGYHLLMFFADNESADDLIDQILQYHVDGLILATTTLSSTLAQQCADAQIPVVLFNRVMAGPDNAPGAQAVSSVRSDNYNGGKALAHCLADSGHRRCAYIAGSAASSTNLERERGFTEGLAERGLPVFAKAHGDYDQAMARQATLSLFAGGRETPDAIFAASDHMAFAVMDTLRAELGLRVPEDVAVVGFDNVPAAEWPAYRLTTYEQPVEPMVQAVVQLLERALDHGHVREDVIVPGRLIVRGSTRLAGQTP
jgi:DNA-binding LacI/PurR family transcriptional regulator